MQFQPLGDMFMILFGALGISERNISLKLSLRRAKPACMAGVRISDPNFNARCGRMKL